MKKTVCTLLSLLLILSSLFALNLITHAASGAWAIQTTRDNVGAFDYSDYDWNGFGENLFPDPTVNHFDVGGEYGRYAKFDSDHNPVAINPYYWWDKYNDAEFGFKRYIDDLINGGNISLGSLTQDQNGYYELAPGYNYGKPSGTLTFHVAMRSPLNWNAVKKSTDYASLTDDGTGVLRFSSSGAWRAVPLPEMEANKYYIVKFNMKSADSKNGSLELCLQFENGNSDLGENAAAVELGSGPACGKVDTFCFVVYSGESAKTDPFIKFYCQTETFFDDFGMYEVSESYVRKQAEGVKLTDPPVYVEPLAFQTTIEGKNADGPVIDYSDFDWDALGENLVPDPTVAHFDAGETGDQYGRYAKIDANYNPVDVNPYYWWDKASDPANGFTNYYKDLAEHDKFDLSALPQDENGYYELETGKCYGAAVRHADQGNKYLVGGVEYDPIFRSPMNLNNGLTIGTYESLTDDGTGVLHYTGAANGSRRYFPLPEMEEDSYYVIKFQIKSNAVNKWTIDFFFWNKPVDEPDSEFNMGVFEADKIYTVSFLAYTGSEAFTDPFIRIYLMGCESLFDNFGVYKVTKEYAYLCSDGAKLYKNSAAGDINGDDEVDNKDLTRLFQYLSNWDVEVNENALDVNGDASVDNKDLTRLFQYLSNWDVEIFSNSVNTVPEDIPWEVETAAQKKMRENEEYFSNYESQFTEPTEELFSAPITSEGMGNALKRAKQLIELKWVPTADTMPGFFKRNSKYEYFKYIEGKEYQGIPYSSVYETNTYVGSNCSIETYVSAICNPNSYVYTKNLQDTCKEPKAITYYGMVCSKFAAYALGITETYNTAHFANIPGMNLIASKGNINVSEIQPADVLLNPGSHTALVTDILRDKSGNVKYVEVSEETTAVRMRCRKWSVADFLSHFKSYDLLRYEYLDSVQYQKSNFVNIFDEDAQLDDRKYDVLTRYGDKCNINFSSAESRTVTFDILTDSWQTAEVYSGDSVLTEINVKNKKEFSFTPENPGYYRVELKNGDKTSRPCYFCMYDAVLTVDASPANAFNVNYSSQTGQAVWFQLGSIADSVYKKSNASGNETVSYTESISQKTIRVAFENEYGVYLSDYR